MIVLSLVTSLPYNSIFKKWQDAPSNLRSLWAQNMIPIINTDSKTPDRLRPWDLVLHLDGSVTNEAQSPTQDNVNHEAVYLARYRIPPSSLLGFQHAEIIKRAELFALGSLSYELVSGHKVFSALSDDEVQQSFSHGVFPDDVLSLEMGALIYSHWSPEFVVEMQRIHDVRASQSAFSRVSTATVEYARSHPYIFGAQIIGTFVSGTLLATPAIATAIGFSALGPVAGSMAAGWQASMPLVQASSWFAWCQSAVMGGTTMGLATIGTGLGAGVGVASLASVAAWLGEDETKKVFERVVLKGIPPASS